MSNPKHTLEHGNRFPYERKDDEYGDTAQPPKDWAHSAARGVLADLTDRRGIKYGFDDIDLSTRVEIVESLAGIIREAKGQPAPSSDKLIEHAESVVDLGKSLEFYNTQPQNAYHVLQQLIDHLKQMEADYAEARASHLAHVKDLDVAMNDTGAAEQALLIDIKAQLLEFISFGRDYDWLYLASVLDVNANKFLVPAEIHTFAEYLKKVPK